MLKQACGLDQPMAQSLWQPDMKVVMDGARFNSPIQQSSSALQQYDDGQTKKVSAAQSNTVTCLASAPTPTPDGCQLTCWPQLMLFQTNGCLTDSHSW